MSKKSLALPAAFRTLIVLFLSFQFSDMLLYTSKGVTGTNQFKIHGHLSLHGMLVSGSMLHHRVKEMALPKAGWGIPSGHEDQSHKLLQGWSQQQLDLDVCQAELSLPAGDESVPSTLAKQLEHTLLSIRFHAAVRGWSGNRHLFILVFCPSAHTLAYNQSSCLPTPYLTGLFFLSLICSW